MEERDYSQQPTVRKEFQPPSVLGVGEKMNIPEKMSAFWYHKQSCWFSHPSQVFAYSCLLLTALTVHVPLSTLREEKGQEKT